MAETGGIQRAVLADDLTGAADTGVQLARAGLKVMVGFGEGALPACDVAVLSTNSRHETAATAAERSRAAVERVRQAGTPAWLYKKIDSTLRGHPAAELQAIAQAWGQERVLIAPAFPGQGRTTVGGRQLVEGTPVEKTVFGNEVKTGDLRRVFGPQAALLELAQVRRGAKEVQRALLQTAGWTVADAVTAADLEVLARAGLEAGLRLFCGSAGLARALQEADELKPQAAAPTLPPRPQGPVLVIAGSQSPVTREQVRRAGAATVQLVDLSPEALAQAGTAAGHLLRSRQDVALALSRVPEGSLNEIVAALGAFVGGLVRQHRPGGLVLTGGETALGVCSVLGAATLWLRGEVEPGIPWGYLTDGEVAGMPVVTKAGGFGSQEALRTSIHKLKQL